MFKLVLVAILIGLATADNINRDAEVRSYQNEAADAEGNFNFAFDSTNGIAVQQTGNIAGVSGSAEWVSPEGVPIHLTYTADENGYHPVGDHLPTPPPIPDAILRSLEYIRTHPPKGIEDTPLRGLNTPLRPTKAPLRFQKVAPTKVNSQRRG